MTWQPPQIAGMNPLLVPSQMEVLYLHGNMKINGSVPVEFANMKLLQKLTVNGTQVTGTIPVGVCSLKLLSFNCSELLCGCNCTCSSSSPSSTPEVQTLLLESLSDVTRGALNDPLSKAYSAYQWIENDPNLTTYSNDRLKQRFALAMLRGMTNDLMQSFGFGSWDWHDSTSWLSYDIHECDWFYQARYYNTYGMEIDDTMICDEEGYLEHLRLFDNNIFGSGMSSDHSHGFAFVSPYTSHVFDALPAFHSPSRAIFLNQAEDIGFGFQPNYCNTSRY